VKEKIKNTYMGPVNQFTEQAIANNHSKKDLFIKVRDLLQNTPADDRIWSGCNFSHGISVQELMNRAAKIILSKGE
jgi:hypothetical protein